MKVNLRKWMFLLLGMSGAGVCSVVLLFAIPEEEANVAYMQPQTNEAPFSGKHHMDIEKIIPMAENEKLRKKETGDGYIDQAIYQLTDEDTVSIDVLVAALKENDSEQ